MRAPNRVAQIELVGMTSGLYFLRLTLDPHVNDVPREDRSVDPMGILLRFVGSGLHMTSKRAKIAVLIVVGLATLSVFAFARFFTGRSPCQHSNTATNAREIRAAAMRWKTMNASAKCPSINTLVEDREIHRASKVTDCWAQPFLVLCEDDDIVVISSGPDKVLGTNDDIKAPGQSR